MGCTGFPVESVMHSTSYLFQSCKIDHVKFLAVVVPSLHAWFESGVAVALYVPGFVAFVVPDQIT